MVTAALVSFAILLVAWIAAPDRTAAASRRLETHETETHETETPDARPIAA